MARIQLLILLAFLAFGSNAQTFKSVQIITASSSINATSDVVVNTGTNTNLTLPAAPAAGRTIQIINHGSGDILLSAIIWVSKTDSFDYIPSYPNEIRPKISTNKISIIWDSTNSKWRLLSW